MLVQAFARVTADPRLVALPRLVLAEAGNFPDMARFYRKEVVARGLAVVAGILEQGMAAGSSARSTRGRRLGCLLAPMVLGALWRATFAAVEDAPLPTETHARAASRTVPARHRRGGLVMKRIAWLLVALALAGCDKPPDEGVFQGYVDADYLRIAAPEAGWLTAVPVANGAPSTPAHHCSASTTRCNARRQRRPGATLEKAESDLADLLKGARPEEIASIEAQLAEAERAVRHYIILSLICFFWISFCVRLFYLQPFNNLSRVCQDGG